MLSQCILLYHTTVHKLFLTKGIKAIDWQ